ncbi:MAG TPA: energy transducer TonB [Dokdonella sp.]
MSAVHLHLGREWEWRRVGAWSGSFAAHLIALALLAAPWAVSRINPTEIPRPTVVVLRDPPPPALPVPPPPIPPPQAHPRKPTMPVHVVEAVPTPIPTPPTLTTEPSAPAQPSAARGNALTQTPAAAASGVAQKLAYDGVLRPAYPTASVRAREQGTVVLRVLVGSDGSVQQVEIERSSGHAKLDAAARETVLRGRFRPVMQNGKAIPAWGLVPIEFRLDRA